MFMALEENMDGLTTFLSLMGSCGSLSVLVVFVVFFFSV